MGSKLKNKLPFYIPSHTFIRTIFAGSSLTSDFCLYSTSLIMCSPVYEYVMEYQCSSIKCEKKISGWDKILKIKKKEVKDIKGVGYTPSSIQHE